MVDARFGDVAGPLKLLARDAEDGVVLSAMLQDAILPVSEMTFLGTERQFVFLLNRFQWEQVPPDASAPASRAAQNEAATLGSQPISSGDQGPGREAIVETATEAVTGDGAQVEAVYYRTHCGVRISGVTRVQTQGIDLADRGRLLNLLGLEWRVAALDFLFSDGVTIRLIGEGLEVRVEDVGQPWPTALLPGHPDDPSA